MTQRGRQLGVLTRPARRPARRPAKKAVEPVSAGTDGHPIRVEFGRRWISPKTAARLKPGSVLELDADVDRPVDVYADGRLLARGTPMAIEGKLCVRVDSQGVKNR
ncbi:MAG TPA: FliM/FliN family flagellar motor C-terminal domain-containing protein [Phycisphaerae bacterium]|nr:FliM/FliN family flagellar motor C-terminal domain-containing protein [Phycisphaerae bacterium]